MIKPNRNSQEALEQLSIIEEQENIEIQQLENPENYLF